MHQIHTYHVSYPALKAARVAILAGAVAGLAVLGACADNSGKTVTAPTAPRTATIPSGTLANGKHIILCVSASSPAGTYTFQNSHENDGIGIGGGFDAGDGGFGTSVFNQPNATNYTVTPGAANCVLVADRTVPEPGFPSVAVPADSYMGVTMTHMSNTVGALYDHTDCLEDTGVLPAQPSPCGTGNNPTRAFANFVHGVVVTFFFTAAPQQVVIPLFVIGDRTHHDTGDIVYFWGSQWWKNNPMSRFSTKGWESFKGFAGTVTLTPGGPFCGTFNSRVGNSPPPPATIPDLVGIIVTDKITKDGPGESGNILQILIVDSDGNYAPNPGHVGRGEVISIECG